MAQRVALVTGGMGGLGEAICIKLERMGINVVVTYSPSNTKHAVAACGSSHNWPNRLTSQSAEPPNPAAEREPGESLMLLAASGSAGASPSRPSAA